MTEAQKIRVLTDFDGFSDEERNALGLPCLKMMHIKDSKEFPSPYAMARSWNTELISEVSAAGCRDLSESGAGQVLMPSPRAAVGKRQGVLSEDPTVTSAISGAYIRGANTAGVSAVVKGYGISANRYTAFHTDESADKEIIYKNYTLPFKNALCHGKCDGIIIDEGHLPDVDFSNTGTAIIRKEVSDGNTVDAVMNGEICLRGSGAQLRRAANRYRNIKSKIEKGKLTLDVLEDAEACGEAISEQILDETLAKKLDYIFRCAQIERTAQRGDVEELKQRAFEGACVLLENRNKTLPLDVISSKKEEHIAVIGDVVGSEGNDISEIEHIITQKGYTYAGYARGYDANSSRSEELLNEAEEVALRADTVFLFLSMDNSRQYKTVPANLVALCNSMASIGNRLIVVLSFDGSPDLGFLSRLENPPMAVLLAPLAMENGVLNAVRVIFGDYSPAGRLPFHFSDRKHPTSRRDGYKIEQFVGYRYYDKIGFGTIYPFGYGLSYTKFKYSSLIFEDGGKISFKVKNCGKYDGVEIAQIYLGIEKSKILRPKKELVGFVAVELAAGESKRVTADLKDIIAYDPEKSNWVVESGRYTVYVGASVSDIKLKKSYKKTGDILKSDGKDASEYFPSETNIFKDNYTLEAKYKPMRSTLRNLFVGITALVLAVAVVIYNIATKQSDIFLYVTAIVLLIVSIVSFILEMCDKKKKRKEDRAAMEKASSKLFEKADRINVPSAKELFAMAESPDSYNEITVSSTSKADEKYDHFGDVDKSLDFALYANEFARFAKEKGVDLSKETATSILASMASSRLIILKGMGDFKFSLLNTLICEYFGCTSGIDRVDDTYVSASDLLFYSNKYFDGSKQKNAYRVVAAAQDNPRNIHIVSLSNVKLAKISDYFSVYSKYVRMPYNSMSLQLVNEENRNVSLNMPENIWFMLNLAEGEKLDELPDYIAQIANVNTWDIAIGDMFAPDISEYHALYYGQMVYMSENARTNFSLDEAVCKKIDRLEKFCTRYSEFKLSNKMWLALEAYVSVLMLSGTEEGVAVDKAIAVKLMPAVISALSGKISRDERGLSETIDVFFGEDHTSECHKVIKTSGANIL